MALFLILNFKSLLLFVRWTQLKPWFLLIHFRVYSVSRHVLVLSYFNWMSKMVVSLSPICCWLISQHSHSSTSLIHQLFVLQHPNQRHFKRLLSINCTLLLIPSSPLTDMIWSSSKRYIRLVIPTPFNLSALPSSPSMTLTARLAISLPLGYSSCSYRTIFHVLLYIFKLLSFDVDFYLIDGQGTLELVVHFVVFVKRLAILEVL